MNQQEAFRWIHGVSDEYDASRAALALAVRRTREAPSDRDHELDTIEPAHLARAANNLEATYVVRLFAEFEAVLRDYWGALRPGKRVRAEVLLQRVGELENMPEDWVADTHEVRDLRNNIVHHRATVVVHSYQQCRTWLARFVSMLPQRW